MKFYPNELTAIKNEDSEVFLESMEVTQAPVHLYLITWGATVCGRKWQLLLNFYSAARKIISSQKSQTVFTGVGIHHNPGCLTCHLLVKCSSGTA